MLNLESSILERGFMQMENFDKLEERINKILGVVDKLKQENDQIASSYNDLSSKIFEYEKKQKTISEENNHLRKSMNDQESKFKTKEEKIKKKLENVLGKIQTLENLN
jgi:predicted  nucleic acid-binding Zn-ribbon protein